ncbi:hypothetical protein PAXINDRAFT_100732 [Paxillus involutus ATCC 200175]|uniref:Uncharacterized protein n=1 Tax=Paxillus involutus ATCC 200175 TaxID=664439 RepID=A0A0C9TCH4_PAXIN|nr:hypothetical protein PAXINDRAFT_100732 [Paxillus involutus ATCC 200175]
MSPEEETASLNVSDQDKDKSLPSHAQPSELLELRKICKARQGIGVHKLSKGDVKQRRRRNTEDGPEDQSGLKAGAKVEDERAFCYLSLSTSRLNPYLHLALESNNDEEDVDALARRAVRTSNFTQQTNMLDVDKHMIAYIEEKLKMRRQEQDTSESKPKDPDEFELSER